MTNSKPLARRWWFIAFIWIPLGFAVIGIFIPGDPPQPAVTAPSAPKSLRITAPTPRPAVTAAAPLWQPFGYQLFNSQIAFRFLNPDKKEFRCSYSGSRCWGLEIVTREGCNTLYAELTVLDTSGRNIDYANDVASNVQQNERVVLIFDSFANGADKARLGDVSCI